MKKIIALILALWAFAAFSVVAGCKKAEEATEPTTSEEQQGTEGGAEEAPAPEQPAQGQE